MSSNCRLCPRECGADRSRHPGLCGATDRVKIARAALHFFEEPPISGTRGSGTVFFCGCALRCCFCQNFEVSRGRVGREISVRELAGIFRRLEEEGAHNINLVSPTPYVPQILEALAVCRPKIPVVYNTHGYESLETLELLRGKVDIFLPDLKYRDPFLSERYSGAADYFERASAAILKMCGMAPRRFDEDGMMQSGVIVRHLMLPMAVYDTLAVLDWLKEHLPPDVPVSLMGQYTPFGELSAFPELTRKLTRREYARGKARMEALGLKGFCQELSSADKTFIPDWDF